LGFNQSVFRQAFPNWALTNRISVALSQVGLGQNHFRRPVPIWDGVFFLQFDVHPIEDTIIPQKNAARYGAAF